MGKLGFVVVSSTAEYADEVEPRRIYESQEQAETEARRKSQGYYGGGTKYYVCQIISYAEQLPPVGALYSFR